MEQLLEALVLFAVMAGICFYLEKKIKDKSDRQHKENLCIIAKHEASKRK